MSKHRVYEIAKEFNTTSKVIIDILARHKVETKNHMSSVDDEAKEIVKQTFATKKDANPNKIPTVVKPTVKTNTEPSMPTVNAGNTSRPAQGQQGYNNNRPSQGQQGYNNNRPSQGQQGYSNNRPAQGQQGYNNNRPAQGQQGYNNNRPAQGQQGYNNNRPAQGQQGYNNNRPAQGQQGYNNNRPAQGQQGYNNNRPAQGQQGYNNNRPAQGQQGYNNNRPAQGQQGYNNNCPAQGQQGYNRPNQSQTASSQNSGAQRSATPNSNNKQGAGFKKPFEKKAGFHDNRKVADLQRKTQHASKRHYKNKHANEQIQAKLVAPQPSSIKVGEMISVKDFAELMNHDVSEIIKKLMLLGVMATINQQIDFDTAVLVAADFDITVEELPPEIDPTEITEVEDSPESLVLRPPVVTVMGHVDHGKTSLLDAIRKANVTAHEAGGITQHIGAYQVNYQNKKIVFLDTPGHEAFTAMRARGAMVTDIAILVVSADDGVMPQTIEAINHAKSAKVPVIVAINKIDRPNANPELVRQQLTEYGLIDEKWGGDTIMVPVSAHQKTGISDLLEMILLVAEMQNIRANPNRPASGTVIEAELDKGRGPVATILIQKGTLHIGDTIIVGTTYGKVRAMVNDRGEKVKKAGPSTPVEVLGLSDVPGAGDVLLVTDEKTARSVAEKRIAKKRGEELEYAQKVSLDDLFNQIKEGNLKQLNLVIKADVQGSIEALRQSLSKLKNDEVKVDVIHAGVGAINESDIMLASASNALILGFNVRPDTNSRKAAEAEKVDVRTYRVIYDAINDVEAALKGMLAPTYKEVIQGRVEIRQVFHLPKTVVAGCFVLEGKVTNNSQIRLLRDGIVTYEGTIDALKRFKDDVKEVAEGYECGISLEKFRDLKEGDIIEAYVMEEIKERKLV